MRVGGKPEIRLLLLPIAEIGIRVRLRRKTVERQLMHRGLWLRCTKSASGIGILLRWKPVERQRLRRGVRCEALRHISFRARLRKIISRRLRLAALRGIGILGRPMR